MSVTAVKMFLWFYSIVATSSVKSARPIEAKKIFLEKVSCSFLLLFQA